MIMMIFVTQNNFKNGPGISDRLLGFLRHPSLECDLRPVTTKVRFPGRLQVRLLDCNLLGRKCEQGKECPRRNNHGPTRRVLGLIVALYIHRE